MQRAVSTSFLPLLMALFALSVSTALQADQNNLKQKYKKNRDTAYETTPATRVSYDRENDHLSVVADAASLKSVLSRIAQLSGIEVLFDDAADEPLSIDIQSDSLEQGLKQILKGRNSVLRYGRDENEKLLLVGVTVLPVGEHGSGRAKRLMAMHDEAYYRARRQIQLSNEQLRQLDIAAERWQVRMIEMSAERREKMEEHVKQRLLREARREARRARYVEMKKQKMAKIAAEERAYREQALDELGPEQRARFVQANEAAREQMKVLLLEDSH